MTQEEVLLHVDSGAAAVLRDRRRYLGSGRSLMFVETDSPPQESVDRHKQHDPDEAAQTGRADVVTSSSLTS